MIWYAILWVRGEKRSWMRDENHSLDASGYLDAIASLDTKGVMEEKPPQHQKNLQNSYWTFLNATEIKVHLFRSPPAKSLGFYTTETIIGKATLRFH